MSRTPKHKIKNPAAVALSKLGAAKGGRARAEKLSARQRSRIAKLAAKNVPLAAFQPRFLIEQIVAACRFKAVPLGFHTEFVDYALSNLSIGGDAPPGTLAKV